MRGALCGGETASECQTGDGHQKTHRPITGPPLITTEETMSLQDMESVHFW